MNQIHFVHLHLSPFSLDYFLPSFCHLLQTGGFLSLCLCFHVSIYINLCDQARTCQGPISATVYLTHIYSHA